MATRESIEFNFKKACDQAKSLDNIANNLVWMVRDKLRDNMQILSQNWQGENAIAYRCKGEQLQDDISKSVKELHDIATDIRTIAKNIYDAEMRALRIAEERKYNK